VDLNLQSILVVVPLYIDVATEPTTSCLPMDICCRWCLGVTEVVVADARVGDDTVVLVFAMAEALAVAPAKKGCLWLAAASLALPFLTRSTIA
jgi:hypothetical protein